MHPPPEDVRTNGSPLHGFIGVFRLRQVKIQPGGIFHRFKDFQGFICRKLSKYLLYAIIYVLL